MRALWLSMEKPPKQFTVHDEAAVVIAIKNITLQSRLIPDKPETMTVKAIIDWAELVRRVTTAYGANAVLIDASLTLDPLLLTLRHTLEPYRISLGVIA